MQRYFSNKLDNNNFELNEDDLYHINTVMRMKNKSNIQVVYNNKPYLCELENNRAKIIKELEVYEDKLQVILIIPLLKEQKFDLILQKSTELGVNKIIPINLSRSIIKLDENNIDKKMIRWNKILKEASEQSYRLDIPELVKPINISDLKELDGLRLVCSTLIKDNNIKNVLKKNSNYDKIYLLVGPEGGLSTSEEDKIIESGFIPVTLGKKILRVETVPLFLLSIIIYENME